MPTTQPEPARAQEQAELAQTSEQQIEQFKTVAVRVGESMHAQLSFIAQLSGVSVSEEIRRAIDGRIEAAQSDPDLISRAEKAREQIEREAAARTEAIAGFMGQTATGETAAKTAQRARRGTKSSEKE